MKFIEHRCNTLESIENTKSCGVEIDVMYKNKELVLNHDRFNKEKAFVLLKDALDLIKSLNLLVLLDIKGVNCSKKLALELKKILGRVDLDNNKLFISSFNENHLYEIKKVSPDVKLGLITSNILTNFPFNKYNFVSIDIEMLNKKFIKKCHKNNLYVFVWNATEKNKYKFNVDFFII
jgi:glycerophosphoryl diester phosphodiesterase